MSKLPSPIFSKKLSKISWKKIYVREYGVSYSEGAILLLSPQFRYHFPSPSVETVVIPEGNNTAFYIDADSWMKLVQSLNNKYTSHAIKLKKYEKDFVYDGEMYLSKSRKINRTDLKKLSNYELKKIYVDYQIKLLRYSTYAWSAFILNNYISEKATQIIDKYIKQSGKESEKQEIYNSLFHPTKRAAILELQYQVGKYRKLTKEAFNNLYKKYKWLSCLDIHNDPWTKEEFKEHIQSFKKTSSSKVIPFHKIIKELKISSSYLEYLLMAQKFAYIKDARDDFRRQSVYLALPLFEEIGRRIGYTRKDVSYIQQSEIIAFLDGKLKISRGLILNRKKGFVMYLDENNKLVCLSGNDIPKALKEFKLIFKDENIKELSGKPASYGHVSGKVIIVRGINDLNKVKLGDILVAVTTHPDYVPAMKKAAAIVTDEGGITSHAAIVSREFGIPCIVGTKYATSVLKDGDRIEVDAITGKIKLIG